MRQFVLRIGKLGKLKRYLQDDPETPETRVADAAELGYEDE